MAPSSRSLSPRNSPGRPCAWEPHMWAAQVSPLRPGGLRRGVASVPLSVPGCGQPRQDRQFLEVLSDRFSRSSPEDNSRAKQILLGEYSGLAPKDDSRTHGSVVAHADLAAQNGAIANRTGT